MATLVALFAHGPTAAAADASPTRSTATEGVQPRSHFPQPLGATVLYDQSGVEVGNITAQDFPDLPLYSSQVADDFTVTDATGWTVTSVAIQENTARALDIPTVVYNVGIFADAGGMPAAQADCDYIDLPAVFDSTNTIATIALDQSCFLAPGTYWLAATPDVAFDTGGQLFAAFGDTGSAIGAEAHWQNPGGAWGGNCPTWTPLTQCADLSLVNISATSTMLFQVIGHTGGQPGRINMTIGMAIDNGDPAQCGTATTLSPAVGDVINVCYTVVNNAPITSNYQSLSDTVNGTIFSYSPITIEPGASYQYNRNFTAATSQAPMSTWTSNDIQPGYAASAGTYDFVDITTTGTLLGLFDWNSGASVTMPFPFALNGNSSNLLCIANNGMVMFGVGDGCSGWSFNFPMPTTQLSTPAFAVFWANSLFSGGSIYTQTLGTTPNRQFVVEYYNKDTTDVQGESPGFTFEMILNESDGSIDYDYATAVLDSDPLNSGGGKANVGIQLSSELANIYSENTASLANGQNIHWTPVATPIVFSDSQRLTLDVGAPIINAVPGPIAATAAAGAAVTVPAYLLNTGDRDLVWSLVEAPTKLPVFASTSAQALHVDAASVTPGTLAHPAASGQSAEAAFAGAAVPAYGVALDADGSHYVSFDVAAPGTLDTVAASTGAFASGTFVNFDFSQEYVVDAPNGDLYTISTTDGTQHLIGNIGLPDGMHVGGLRWDVTTGTTYLMGAYCPDDIGSITSSLYTIDLATAAITLVGANVGALSCMADITFDPISGLLYAFDTRTDIVWMLDKTSGAFVSAAVIGGDFVGPLGLDFDASSGALYLAASDGTTGSIYLINTVDFTVASIGTIGTGGVAIGAFAIARPTPPCTRPADIPWLSLDPESGTAGPGLVSSIGVTLDATNLAAGDYAATVCVHSNDYQHLVVAMPISFTVTASGVTDVIFANGFDGG